MRKLVASTLVALVVSTSAGAALAQGSTADRAKSLFNAGAAAYSSGQFTAAIQAFDEANRLYPRPQIGFSLAQAHRRQYFIDRNAEHLKTAIKLFHDYLDQVPEGGRRADAAQALGELEPIAARTDMSAVPAAGPPPKEPTRLMVLSQPEDAAVEIDGKAAKAGIAMEVAPGKHHVKVSAAGYVAEEKEVQAIDNTLRPIDFSLKEKPAHIVVDAPNGATISVDGRPSGETPQLAPIDVPAGVHLVVVTKNGHRAFTQEVDVGRDERKRIAVDLRPTTQRVVAYGFFIGAAAAVVTGGVFTGLALKKQGEASDILDRQPQGTLTPGDLSTYDAARDKRDTWNTASYVAYGIGAGALVTGAVLYFFDQPVVTLPTRGAEEKKKPSTPSGPKEPIEMSFAPALSPDALGGAFVGRF